MTPYTLDHQHQLVLAFMEKANQETPTVPTIPSFEVRKLRAKLILEEALETVAALGIRARPPQCDIELTAWRDEIEFTSASWWDEIIKIKEEFREEGRHTLESVLRAISDGCADLKVVTVGTEIACGINGKPIFEEVMRSNFTKFIDGHMREDGKWQKGPSYEPPNIEPILKAQGMK